MKFNKTSADSVRENSILTSDQAIQQAIAHQQAGELQDAERLYRAILRTQPNHSDANHNLGVLAVQVKQPAAGLPHFKVALEANPKCGQYWLSYIDALLLVGQLNVARQLLAQGRQHGLQGDAVDALDRRLTTKMEDSSNKTTKHKGSKPASKEIDTLMALFTAGRYSEAEFRARGLIDDFPGQGIGWKALGVILQRTERHVDALQPLQQAIKLLPNDAEAQYNLGVSLHQLGYLKKAEEAFRKVLGIKNNFMEAHSNLGVVLKELGRVDEAEASFRYALKINPKSIDSLNNLGFILYERGRLNEAELHFRRLIELQPTNVKAHSNLSLVLRQQRRLNEAEASCLQAIDLNPQCAEAYNTLGAILFSLGRIEESINAYQRAIVLDYELAEAHLNLGHVFCDLDDWAKAAALYRNAYRIDPEDIGLDAAVYSAIIDYLCGNINESQNNIDASRPILAKLDLKHKNAQVYWRYLDKLITWRQSHDKLDLSTQSIKSLHVIGESHSLSAHGAVVRFDGQEMRCKAEWISGCKQWHLGNDKANKYKHKFEVVMSRLPRNSTILMLVGEIDCRHDEGIFKLCQKYPEMSQTDVVESTVDAYIKYVAEISRRYGHRVIIGAVPAPNIRLAPIPANEVDQVSHIVKIFNARLKIQSQAEAMSYLDLYKLTNRGDGVACDEWHIDNFHLVPNAVVKAFDKYCL